LIFLKNYISYESYFKLIKTIKDDPEFEWKRKPKKLLRNFVEVHPVAISRKTDIMLTHFMKFYYPQDTGKGKSNGGNQVKASYRAI